MIPLKEMQWVELFKPLSEHMIEELAAIGEVVSVPSGEYIFRAGDPAEAYYVVKEGNVILEFGLPDGSVFTETAGPGTGIGYSALIGLTHYFSHGRCEEPLKLLRWPQSALRHLFNQDSRLGYLMMRASAKMLDRRTSGKVKG